MDTSQIGDRAVRALKADATVFSEIGADEAHTAPTALIVASIGAVGGLITAIFTADTGLIGGIIGGIVGAFLGWVIGTAIFYGLAKMFSGEGDFQGLMRGNAYAAIPSAVAGIPVIGWLIGLYGIYLFVLNVRENMKLSTGAAVAVVLIPMAILFALFLVLIVFVLAAFTSIAS